MTVIPDNEHLAYIMQSGVISLSNQDLEFIGSLYHRTLEKKPITTNQNFLFKKLVQKYNRQLQKNGISQELVNSLNWTCPIVPSDKKYTEAYITITDGKITFKAPFNKNFLSSFRAKEDNTFKWDHENKCQVSDFSTSALKLIVTVSNKFYPVINYCDTTLELLNTLFQYENVKYWTPTLVKSNNNYYIAACNESLLDAISDIKLDADIHVLDELSRYGITIDPSITENDIDMKLAGDFLAEADLINIDDTVALLKLLGYNTVNIHHKCMLTHRKFIQKKFEEHNIKDISSWTVYKGSKNVKTVLVHMMPDYYDISEYGNVSAQKIIKIKNSTPVTLK